jgi:hypothetical protein
MSGEIGSLAVVALLTGGLHTLVGPDHYVPFVAMSRAGGWSVRRTLLVTWLCGLGHVAGSVLLGSVGIALGLAVHRLERVETTRGGIAGWLLIGLGLAYLAWGIVRGIRNRPHTHVHAHVDGTVHRHPHEHHGEHLHPHPATADRGSRMTPWILFTVFFLGPCEPLVPLLMYPAAKSSVVGVVLVTLLFSIATLATMTVMVALLLSGATFARARMLGRFGHAVAGGLVLGCGIAVTLGV